MKKIAMAVMLAGLLTTVCAQAQTKLGPAAPVTYDNKYEVYGGLNFMNFMAGQDLTRRMDFGGGEFEGTYWLTRKWGLAAEYRGEAGTTPVFPNARIYGIHRPLVYMNMVLFGAQYRWMQEPARGARPPRVWRAVVRRLRRRDRRCRAGTPGISAASNAQSHRALRQPHRSDLRAGRQCGHEPLQELGGAALAGSDPG